MADYKELLRRAVEALPENNGAARRAVYEKARAALVGQLRAINPPLPARDITAHRLQLEDCIRQVEQEASEAVIAGISVTPREEAPPPPVYFDTPKKPGPGPVPAQTIVARPKPAAPEDETAAAPEGESIEDIIAQADAETAPPPRPRFDTSRPAPEARGTGRPLPRLQTTPRPGPQARIPLGGPQPGPDLAPPGPAFTPRGEAAPAQAAADRLKSRPTFSDPAPSGPSLTAGAAPAPGNSSRPLPPIVARAEAAKARTAGAFPPVNGGAAAPRRAPIGPRLDAPDMNGSARAAEDFSAMFAQSDVPPAMSAVRQVEADAPADPQNQIDRAIATLDREARGDTGPGGLEDDSLNGFGRLDTDDEPAAMERARLESRPGSRKRTLRRGRAEQAPSRQVRPRAKSRGKGVDFVPARGRDDRGLSPLSIFAMVFGVLLIGAIGLGVWAWREGFLDLGSMFGTGAAQTEVAAEAPAAPAKADAPATGPGNTDTPVAETTPKAELTSGDGADRLATDTPAVPADAQSTMQTPSSDERLGADTAPDNAATAAVDATAAAGSQSLLLEANDVGKTGAVPFSGTIEWSKGTDEMGVPTLVGKATIPARNLTVDLLIRKNSDPSLPASHLMEVNFKVNESFVGGSIAGLPGVLLKNEELVQGTPLVGASARVVGNSFLFALSAAPEDQKVNIDMLTGRKWMDLALIYATGKRAIITLEKDVTAMALFADAVKAWTAAADAAAAAPKTN